MWLSSWNFLNAFFIQLVSCVTRQKLMLHHNILLYLTFSFVLSWEDH